MLSVVTSDTARLNFRLHIADSAWLRNEYILCYAILAHGGASSRDDPVGGAGSGVLRPRLVTAGSGGPGHRPSSLSNQRFLAFLARRPPMQARHSD